MRPFAFPLLLSACLAAPGVSLAQEVAGRVLIAVGDVTIVRGAQRIPAQLGTQVRAGDTFELGRQSNAQIQFTDESLVALRPETTFKIEQYSYQDKPAAEQKTLYSLLKGGMRTVTGLIGRVKHENYAVQTPTSTIGIRGTHYTLVQCDNSCREPNGTLAPNGTYGGVTDGRIGVTNQSGEHQFGADQYFHVASRTDAPTQLIAPPGFLRDTLEGRARARERQRERTQQARTRAQQPSASSGSESTQTLASTSDARISSSTTTYVPPVVLNPIVTPATPTAPTTNLVTGALSTVFYHLDSLGGGLSLPVLTCGNPPCGTITAGSFTLGVNLLLQRAYLKADFATNGGDQFSTGTPFSSGGIPISVSGSQITFSGTFNRVDYPNEQGAFRCSGCGTGTGPSFLNSISVSGVINGSTANLNFAATDAGGGGSFAATLTQQTPPNNLAATTVFTNVGGGATAFSKSYWDVAVNGAGQPTRIGTPGVGSNNVALVGSASNSTAVSFTLADGSQIIGGAWTGGGATLTDANYATYTSGSTQDIPWIVGSLTNTLPATLGTSVTYTPVAWTVNPGHGGTLNSGSLTADFVNRNLSISLNATNTVAGNTFQMNGTSGISATSARFGSKFSGVTCTGPCNSGAAAGGAFSGFFAGTNAEGAGVAFHAGFGTSTNGVIGVVGLKR